MLFNSYAFIFIFLPVVFIGTFLLGHLNQRLAAIWLGLASITFYAIWDARFVLLLLGSIAFNYGMGLWVGNKRSATGSNLAKYLLFVAIFANLILLSYFKYANFFITTTNQIFENHISAFDIILPLGISFFTFTQIAFLVDVYRGIAREYNFSHYLLFVTYFPHLIAGPVLHHKQMMPQFANPNTFRINTEHMAVGLTIFVIGLAKKVLIADTLAEYATPIFSAASHGYTIMLFEAWVGALAYTLQLYFDFSGYSDMAIGLSLIFNVRLPINFDSPYKSTNIIDFWRRWHMTLSAFLRDYLYIPLGGSRKGPKRRYINLMATMLLGGLWHGAGWTFIIWGGLHGFYLIINHGWREVKTCLDWSDGGKLGNLISVLLTFISVVVAWVFFRADSIATASSMLSSMIGIHGVSLPSQYGPILQNIPFLDIQIANLISGIEFNAAVKNILISLILVWFFPNAQQMFAHYKPVWEDIAQIQTPSNNHPEIQGRIALSLSWKLTAKNAIVIGFLFSIVLLSMISNKTSEFLYFQF